MWFSYTDSPAAWHMLNIEQVKEIMAENKQKKKVASLEDFVVEVAKEPTEDFNNAMGQESLTRFDKPNRKRSKPNKKKKPTGEARSSEAQPQAQPLANNNNGGQPSNPNQGGGGNRPKNKHHKHKK